MFFHVFIVPILAISLIHLIPEIGGCSFISKEES